MNLKVEYNNWIQAAAESQQSQLANMAAMAQLQSLVGMGAGGQGSMDPLLAASLG